MDEIAKRLGSIGEHRESSRLVVVEFPVTVTIDWPDGIEYTDEKAKDVATCVVSQRCDRDVGGIGKIVWAKCYAEVSDDEAEVIEGGDAKGPSIIEQSIPRNSDYDGRF